MTIEFRMPSLGPDMESGTLVEWRVAPGDRVRRGDVVALVETEKGIIDVEIFNDGIVERLLAEKGAHVPVGTVIAVLGGTDSSMEPVVNVPSPRPVSPPAPRAAAAEAHAPQRVKISPAARVRAQALGVDPAQIDGTGAGGAITLDDVTRAASTTPTKEPVPHAPDMRAVIAKAMARAKREIPHYYLIQVCPFERARAWLDAHNATVSMQSRVLPAAMLLKAVALAARAYPDFNGRYGEQGFVADAAVNVGVAVAMRGGRLVAPALLDADRKSLTMLMQELRDLTQRVRNGHMRGSELSQPTITVTSLADEGPDTIVPVIYPPQVAMVGFGAIAVRPWVVDGVVKAIPTVNVTLAADHRVTDGRAGARFLGHIHAALQAPENL